MRKGSSDMKFKPHEYQKTAIKHILDHPAAALLLDMGLGKTVITLTAILYLMKMKMIRKVLVIAPLRVAKNTWPAETSLTNSFWNSPWRCRRWQ